MRSTLLQIDYFLQFFKQTPSLQTKPKLDIPVPRITIVESYNKDLPANYIIPKSYVRYQKATVEEIENTIEYNLDEDDELWLANHPIFGTNNISPAIVPLSDTTPTSHGAKKQKKSPKSSKADSPIVTSNLQGGIEDKNKWFNVESLQVKPCLSQLTFEHMLDLLENATAFETIITLNQAERLIINRIPYMIQIFGSSGSTKKDKNKQKQNKKSINVKIVIKEVYDYWVNKRCRLRKPLLRKYWPVTATNDTNPHMVFRPREKEKYKLRKKRQNDVDAFNKMKQLRTDFEKVRLLLDLVKRREQIHRCMIDLQTELFEQQIFDMVDTSGLRRKSNVLLRSHVEKLLNVPKYFETQSVDRQKKRKRRRSGAESKSSSPVPKFDEKATSDDSSIFQRLVAGQDHGTPAPLFLHPLESRETYTTTWDNAVPFVTSYIDSHATPTYRFRHRPRVGRGGRIIIDRFPRPCNSSLELLNVFTSGDIMPNLRTDSDPAERLLQLLPKPLEHEKISRRIEEICSSALIEDKEIMKMQNSNKAGNTDLNDDDGDEILVKLDDWLNTDEQLWGEERFTIGSL